MTRRVSLFHSVSQFVFGRVRFFNFPQQAGRRALTVETLASGEFEPSLVRKMGSVPFVRLNRACTPAGVMVQASSARWQVPQLRPLVPRFWKNSFLKSIDPLVLNVA